MNLFIKRSLRSVFDFFKEAVFSEDIARSDGLLQSISPGIKVALLVMILIAACLARNFPGLIGLYIVSIILAVLSKIDVVFFLKRVWFFIPIFTLLIAVPAVFMQGVAPAGLFVLRVTTCVSFAVLVILTTKHSRLLQSLRTIGVPSIFVEVFDMTYRYIFLLVKIFEEMHLGLEGRLIGKFSVREAHRWIASRMAFLFRRSLKMSEDVYMAMVARGYLTEINRNRLK